MFRYIFKRLIFFIPVLWVIATLTFFMVRMAPGDPFSDEKEMTEEVRDRIKAYYGLDQPLWKQYLIYLGVTAKEVDKHRVTFAFGEGSKEYRREDVNATLRVTTAAEVTHGKPAPDLPLRAAEKVPVPSKSTEPRTALPATVASVTPGVHVDSRQRGHAITRQPRCVDDELAVGQQCRDHVVTGAAWAGDDASVGAVSWRDEVREPI